MTEDDHNPAKIRCQLIADELVADDAVTAKTRKIHEIMASAARQIVDVYGYNNTAPCAYSGPRDRLFRNLDAMIAVTHALCDDLIINDEPRNREERRAADYRKEAAEAAASISETERAMNQIISAATDSARPSLVSFCKAQIETARSLPLSARAAFLHQQLGSMAALIAGAAGTRAEK